MGGRAALATSMRDLVTQVEGPLRQAICGCSQHPTQPSSRRIALRRRACWPTWATRAFQSSVRTGRPSGCRPARQHRLLVWVAAGAYPIGGWEQGENAVRLPLPAFWIARYPVTVAQYTRLWRRATGRVPSAGGRRRAGC
ncbi:MAG: hypothetical protein U0Z44_08400 [Kouleothrix sp.]